MLNPFRSPWSRAFLSSSAALVSLLVLIQALSTKKPFDERFQANFRTMEIDRATLRARLKDELPWPGAPDSDYYFRFLKSDGRYTIDHFGPGGKVRYNSFFVNADNSLSTRTKYQVLLSGPFGTVYAKTTYFYGPEYTGQGAEFLTVPYANDVGHEPSQLTSALSLREKLTLSAVSVVRIFRAAPEYLIVSANYAPDGHLESLHVNGSKQGNWVHSNEVHSLYPELDVATMIGDRPKTREHFGIPSDFPVQQYLRQPKRPFRQVALENFLDVVNLHYERNQWVRQDSFLPDGAHDTRFLTYVVTSEDGVLALIDSTRLFGQFPYTRKATNRR